MSNSPVRRPVSQVEDFKARFGVIQGQRKAEQRYAEQQGLPPPSSGFSSRQIIAAIALALLAGMSGAGVFWFAQDMGVRKPSATPAPQQSATPAPVAAAAPEKAAEPVVTPAPAPSQNSSLQKTEATDSPVLVGEVPVAASTAAPATAVAVAKIQDRLTPAVAEATEASSEPEAAPAVLEPAATEVQPQPQPAQVASLESQATPTAPAPPAAATSEPAAVTAPVQEPAEEPPAPAVAEVAPAPMVEPPSEPVAEVPGVAEAEPQVVALATVPAAAAPSIVAGQVWRDCEACPELVAIVAPKVNANGSTMQFAAGNEAAAMQPFAIGRFEITFDDWSQCVAAGGCSEMPPDAGFGAGMRPVINISYRSVDEQYLPWLSKLSGKSYRLPTSQEWDISEAGGEAGMNRGLIAPDYQQLCRSANFAASQAGAVACEDPYSESAPVGSYQSNAIGLHDMRGNVWEWVADCWTPGFNYKAKPSERDCRKHVVRGGSWSSQPTLGTTAPRGFEDQNRASKTIGFRVARNLP